MLSYYAIASKHVFNQLSEFLLDIFIRQVLMVRKEYWN